VAAPHPSNPLRTNRPQIRYADYFWSFAAQNSALAASPVFRSKTASGCAAGFSQRAGITPMAGTLTTDFELMSFGRKRYKKRLFPLNLKPAKTEVLERPACLPFSGLDS
jgi:hypothetical protein